MMTSARSKKASADQDSTPQPAQSTPNPIGYGGPDHSFTLQAIMELQKSFGQVNSNLEAMKASLDSTKSKVEDLVGWKNKILGGAAVLGFVFAALGALIVKASDYIAIKTPHTNATAIQAPQTTPAQSHQAQPPAAK